MKNLVFVGSHLGYPMDRTPLGGGAMVAQQLIKHWDYNQDWRLIVLGSGPQNPPYANPYVRLAEREEGLVGLGELAYARFCRDFENQSTQWILDHQQELPPKNTTILVNDISEGPTLSRLTESGYSVTSIWHVDVVDYFNKLYLRRLVAPEKLTLMHERIRSFGIDAVLPDVLQLVFEKQRETVFHSKRIIVPSSAMATIIKRCYSHLIGPEELNRRITVIPWGVWSAEEESDNNRLSELKDYYQISPDTLNLITLSRISPEKGIHILLEALRLLEINKKLDGLDIRLFICGEPAFMMGQSYHRKVKQAAARLKKVKVVLPGYLDAPGKRVYLKLAHLFISPSVHESYGLNVIEAMSAGLPILASDHYGVRDMLPPDAGRLVHFPTPKKAPPLLASALFELIAKRDALKTMGEAAKVAALAMPFTSSAQAVRLAALGLIS